MKKAELLNAVVVAALAISAFMSLSIPMKAEALTVTSTIVGWLVPDATHFANTLLVLMLPLAGLAFFAWMGKTFKVNGEIGVTLALGGMMVGSIIVDLPANGSNTLAVPFADIVVIGILTFFWWWNT